MSDKDNLHGIGMLIPLCLVHGSHLAGYEVKSDGSDGCCVCFAAREFTIGHRGQCLDGAMVRICEMVLPDDVNSAKRALFHRNRGYAIAEVVAV